VDDPSSAKAAKVKKTIKKSSGGVTEKTVAEGTAAAATKVKKTKKKTSIKDAKKTVSEGTAAEATGAKKPKKKKASPKVAEEALPEGTWHVIGGLKKS